MGGSGGARRKNTTRKTASRKTASRKTASRKTAGRKNATVDPTVRASGTYVCPDGRCREITKANGRCKLPCKPGSTFCHLHQRRVRPGEDAHFDSTFAHVYDDIWIGSLDTANDPDALQRAGIRSVVNISGWEPPEKTRQMYARMPRPISYQTTTTRARDSGELRYLGDRPLRTREDVLEFDDYMQRGCKMIADAPRPCLVHCHAGINRSASLIAAYLMRNLGLSFADALAHLHHANRRRDIDVLTNKSFVRALSRYERR